MILIGKGQKLLDGTLEDLRLEAASVGTENGGPETDIDHIIAGLLEASFCFFSIQDTALINVLTYGAKSHGKYPLDIYGKGILRFCTYVIPYTLIQYYPLQFLLGKTRNWHLAFCPLGIIVFLLICYSVWRFGVKHYKSCGS